MSPAASAALTRAAPTPARDRGTLKRPTSGRPTSRGLLVAFSVVVVVMLVGMAVTLMLYLRATALRDAGQQMTTLGAALAEQTARTLQSVELALDLVEDRLRQLARDGADGAAIHAMLRARAATIPQVRQIVVVGPDGRVSASSRFNPPPELWLGDRPHFLQQRDQPGSRLAIGAPLQSRATGEWLIMVSRRLEHPDGAFAGVIDIGLDPAYFEAVYRGATASEGTAITLLRDDAVLLARQPRDGAVLGQQLVDSTIFRQIDALDTNGTIRAVSRFSGEARIFAPRRVPGYPLVVNPSISEPVVLAQWRRQAWFIGVAAIAATIAIIALMILLRASEARSRRQAVVLQDAVDALSEGFVLYDAQDRLVVCNQRFRELRPREPAAYEPGITFENILRLAIRSGDIVVPKGVDPELWIEHRLAQHRGATGVIMRETGGRILRISERRTSDGGIVGIQADVTEIQAARAALEASQARLADWAAASNDWFWETDSEHYFTYISEGVLTATGIKPTALIGRRIDQARFSHNEAPRWHAHLETLAARAAFRDFVVGGVQRGTGRPYFVSVSGKPFVDADGKFAGYRGTGRDVTAQIEAERALAHQTEIFKTLIEHLNVGVTLVDRELNFVAFNRPFLDIYGFGPDELRLGDPFEKFIRYHAERGEYGPGDVDALVGPVVERALDPNAHQFERKRPNGQVVEIRRVPLSGGGFVTTYIDVSQARQREFDLEDTRARLERQARELDEARIEAERARTAADAANRAKSLFLANMSHELRTPLNAILGFSEVTREAMMGPLDARYRDYAREIHASGQYLLRLINDVLDTSKIEVDRMALHDEPVDLADVVGECHRLLRERAEDAKLAVTVTLPRGLPALVADRLRIKQIVLNLLSNAMKFTPAGGRIEIAAHLPPPNGPEGGGLDLVIADTGIGMRPEDIPAALEPFRQVENPMTRHYEGTGLGLPLAKALIELHGGRLTIESTPGQGTAVTVWLPPQRLRAPIGLAASVPRA